MTDKEKIKAEVSTLIGEALLEHAQYATSPNILYDLKKEYSEKIVALVDSMQEEPVSIWHDASKETPIQGSNILMVRKEENCDFPPIAGCFHGTNSRSDGRNWGYYNGFCYNEIEPPLKWAYVDDILNLSNVGRIGNEWKEEPISIDFEQELYKAFGQVKDFTIGMRIAKRFYDMGKNSYEPVSEDLEEACLRLCPLPPCYNEEQRRSKDYEGSWRKARDEQHGFRLGANWQKQQLMKDAVDGSIYKERIENGVGYTLHAVSDTIEGFNVMEQVKLIIIKKDRL